MVTLRLLNDTESEHHDGEVFACTFTPDGAFVLSAGWDAHLRLWEVTSGLQLSSLRAGAKPLSSCAVTPDCRCWVTGSMEGLLTHWDPTSHLLQAQQVVHTRPVSCLQFSPDGQLLATTSWDRQVSIRSVVSERDTRTFTAHEDIVAGCRFTPDGSQLLTWSYDHTLKLWDVGTGRLSSTWADHTDRVTAGDISPDGSLAASGSRNGELILWDVEARVAMTSMKLGAEVRGCWFLLDGASLLALDSGGMATLLSVPDLKPLAQLSLGQAAQCGALSPSGDRLAVGTEAGHVLLIGLEGNEELPLVVTATQTTRRMASRLQRLFGRSSLTKVFACVCPACRSSLELLDRLPSEPAPCPYCRRILRFNRKTLVDHQAPC